MCKLMNAKKYREANQDKISCVDIAKMVMRQEVSSLDKQCFVAIPNRNILLPDYNDAYSDQELNAGVNHANNFDVIPQEKLNHSWVKEIMAYLIAYSMTGRQGLAAYNKRLIIIYLI